MRQRLALERALLHRPRLLLLDEPFTGLDDASARTLVGRLAGLRSEGTIVLVTTHDLDLVEGLLDQAIILKDGRVVDVQRPVRGLRDHYRRLVGRGGLS
jgi:ABC-type multidrug transport system ATPase subunit